MSRPGRIGIGLLLVVFLVLAVRLAGFVVAVGNTSLQMDFSSFYTAGRAVASGLSPYVNHVGGNPSIWDGIGTFGHSRFLYPPLAARLFQPFGLLGYHHAKFLWMVLCLIALGAAMGISARMLRLRATPLNLLALGVAVVAFYPVRTLLERGQIDSLTLLILLAAVALMRAPRTSLAAGALLALATLLKLHCGFFLPFLLARRRWRVVSGFLAGGAILLLLGLALDGTERVQDYAFNQLPRISRHGEGGTRAMRLPAARFQSALQGVEPGRTRMDGREYDREHFKFVLNGSLVRTPLGRGVWNAARKIGVSLEPAHVSLIFLAVGFVVTLVWQRRCGFATDENRDVGELVYWQIVLVLILLTAPVTWAMNTVWLLPVVAIVLREARRPAGTLRYASLAACGLGLVLAATPDRVGDFTLWAIEDQSSSFKYLAAELSTLAGLLGLWRSYRHG